MTAAGEEGLNLPQQTTSQKTGGQNPDADNQLVLVPLTTMPQTPFIIQRL